jgi:hypothetical protein
LVTKTNVRSARVLLLILVGTCHAEATGRAG